MRKILYILPPIALILCLVLGLLMTGKLPFFQSQPSASSSQNAPGTTASTTSTPAETSGGDYVRQNMISISLPEMTNTVLSEDGVVLFRHTFQDVSLISPNPRVNEAVTLDLLQRMDINASTVVELENMTQSYTPGTPWSTLYYEFLYSPTRIDSSVLSLKGAESIFSGSGQANSSIICVNYYMPTGSVMTLAEVLSEESGSQDTLLQALLQVLAHNANTWGLYEDYSEPVIRYFSSYLQQESNWFFSPEGLNICFAPYEIAPQSAGTVVATIPYEALAGALRSDLLPAEYSPVTGTIRIADLSTAPLDRYTYFAECLLTAEGSNYLITTDTILYDVRLELGSLEADGSFIPSSTVFAANSLCSDQAIRLCWTADSQQILLRCITGGTEKVFLLYANPDGGFHFAPVP
ncbi:MAG: DUF3298 domain-containing protein [Oscillospiraceae bacterium]|nr:DUF3298 domain-containing protein [Oscillospiraceae bacterium]